MTGPFRGCINDAEGDGKITPEAAADARDAYDDAYAASEHLGPEEADRQAATATLTALEKQSIENRRRIALTVRVRKRNLQGMQDYLVARGYTDVKLLEGGGATPAKKGLYDRGSQAAQFVRELVDGSGDLAGTNIPSVKGRYQAIFGGYQARMASLIERMESISGLPIRGRALMSNIVREAFGEATGDEAAKALALTWGETAEAARLNFNAAGGAIDTMDKWGLPQAHDAFAIRAAGKDAWVAQIQPLLNREKMTDRLTGAAFTEKRLQAVLSETWDAIVTSGADGREAGQQLGKGSLANRRQDSRFLAFKDADSWMAYQARFGRGDAYHAMIRHLDGMARDTARLQVLGPNADYEFERIANVADRLNKLAAAAEGSKPEGFINTHGTLDLARRMYEGFKGEVSGPYGAENVAATVGATLSAGVSSFTLGAAALNDVSNLAFAAQTRALIGLSRTGDFQAWFKWLASGTTRQQAHRTGLIFELTRDRHAANIQRVLRAQTVGGKTWAGWNATMRLLPQYVQTASFLNANFNASRHSFQHEFLAALSDRAQYSLEAMLTADEPQLRAFGEILQARGITPDDWLKIAGTPHTGGVLTPRDIAAAHGDELSWRVAEMVERETRNAVPEPSLEAQTILKAGQAPGTIMGETLRSAMAYRSFSVTQSLSFGRTFLHRAYLEAPQAAALPFAAQVAKWAAPLLISCAMMGAAILWMRDIAAGKDPRPLWDEDDPKEAHKRAAAFIAAAMAQGGGQGVLGDMFYSVTSRTGKTTALTQLGPQTGLVSDLWDYGPGTVGEMLDGKDPNPGRKTANLLRRYTPLSTLWWTRTAWDRMVVGELQKQIDPHAEQAFALHQANLRRQTGQEEWWPVGKPLPERAPSFGGVLGQER